MKKSKAILPFFTLLASMGTLVCCAFPALLVSLGFGATLVSLLGIFPQLIWISENKDFVFAVAAVLLAGTGFALYNAKELECPPDKEAAEACRSARGYSRILFIGSLVMFGIGLFFAYLAPLMTDVLTP